MSLWCLFFHRTTFRSFRVMMTPSSALALALSGLPNVAFTGYIRPSFFALTFAAHFDFIIFTLNL